MSGRASCPPWAGWLGAVLLFFAALWANTRHNNFPIAYHYDEPGKVQQVVSGKFRLNQPALMIEATAAAANFSGAANSPQRVGEIGRDLSAVYAAAAVTLLAAMVGRAAGARAAVFAALLLLPQRQIVLAAHYFKEDAILLMGLAAAWVALFHFCAKPNRGRAALLGAACGLALSAKFIGATMLIPAIVALGWEKIPGPARERTKLIASFLVALVVAVAVLNLRALLHPGVFAAGFSGQIEAVEHGNSGTGGRLPNWRNFGMCFLEVSPLALALSAFFLARLWREKGALKFWLLAFFPAGYAAALLFSAMGAVRYSLPVVTLTAVIAALALERMLADAKKVLPSKRKLFLATTVAVAMLTVGWDWRRGVEVWQGFGHDSRRELAQFLATMPHPPAVLAEDAIAQLEPREPMRVLATNYVADFGTVEEMRRRGVTHVVICWLTCRRFFEDSKVTQDWAQTDFNRRREFYAGLRETGKCIFVEPMGKPDIMQPGLELYDITRNK